MGNWYGCKGQMITALPFTRLKFDDLDLDLSCKRDRSRANTIFLMAYDMRNPKPTNKQDQAKNRTDYNQLQNEQHKETW